MFLSPRRWCRGKGAVGLGRRKAEGSGGACRARLKGGSPCPSHFAASSRRRASSAWGAAKPTTLLVLAERDLGAARLIPLASPLFQEEGCRRLGAPPCRGLGWCSHSAPRGWLAMSSRFPASVRRRAASAWGAAEQRTRLVLAERDLGSARHVSLASALIQEEGRSRVEAPPSRRPGWCLQSATWGRLAMFLSLHC